MRSSCAAPCETHLYNRMMKPDTLIKTLATTPASAPLSAENYWTADQLRVMQGLELPTWFRPARQSQESHSPESHSSEPHILEPFITEPHSPEPPSQQLAATHNLVQQHYPWLVIASESMDSQAEYLWGNMLASVGKTPQFAYTLVLPEDACAAGDPFSDAAQAVLSHIHAQLGAMQPKLIIAMGVLPAQILLAVEGDLPAMQGELHEFEGLPLLVMEHPAALLKTPKLKAQAWRDLNLAHSNTKSRKQEG